MKKSIVLSLIFAFFFLGLADAEAQRKRRTKKRTSRTEATEDRVSFKDKLAWEIGIGNPNFSSFQGVSTFSMGLKPGLGYIVSSRLSPGIFTKAEYLFQNVQGTDNINLFDYGAGAFLKFKIVESIYLRGEYTFQSYGWDRGNQLIGRADFWEPLIGVGYKQINPGSNWNLGGEVLFHTKDAVRDYSNSIIEFWIKFDHKF